MDHHADAVQALRKHRSELLRGLRELGITRVRLPVSDSFRKLRLVAHLDAHVALSDIYDAEVLLRDYAGEPVDLVSIGTATGTALSKDAVDL
jgi:hypothetical protein